MQDLTIIGVADQLAGSDVADQNIGTYIAKHDMCQSSTYDHSKWDIMGLPPFLNCLLSAYEVVLDPMSGYVVPSQF